MSPVQSKTLPTAMMNWAVSCVLPGLTTPPLVVTSCTIRPLPLALQRLISQQAERLLGELDIARRDERLQGIACIGPEPPRVLHQPAAETAADARHLSDQPLRVDLHPVVDLLQALVGNGDSCPLEQRRVVRLLSGKQARMVRWPERGRSRSPHSWLMPSPRRRRSEWRYGGERPRRCSGRRP